MVDRTDRQESRSPGPNAMSAKGVARLLASDEWSFAILRAMAMLGGMVALFLAPVRPEHQPHLAPLAWTFVAAGVAVKIIATPLLLRRD